jgi:sulfoxide reductase heme-binding subunit YedZ
MTLSDAMWAFGRISGVVSLLLFTATVMLGIVTRSGRRLVGMPRFSVSLVHRNVSLLACVFLVFHVGALLLDSYAKLDLTDVVVPFIGSYKPLWQGWGTVSFDLVVAIVLTSLLRNRLGAKTFRVVHWLTYAMWPIALLHAVGNGTDGTAGWFLSIAAACALGVAGCLVWRLSARFIETAHARGGRV